MHLKKIVCEPLCSVETYKHKSLAGTIPVTSHAHTLTESFRRSHTHSHGRKETRTGASKPQKHRAKGTKDGRKRTLERLSATLVIARFFNSLTQFECRLAAGCCCCGEFTPKRLHGNLNTCRAAERVGWWLGWVVSGQPKATLLMAPDRHSGDR
ncbi:hypothetical protein M5D96_009925 [Drosophila gunungcola]|uniref:Uncharacterized protein n=1 Tax=Drosophila gunungcola TaxID=103775 RepID=A0A9Q0BM20_9MUSC|nr:hypothetical protein M5D96_009925 [Drosophila gunungcola]